MPDLWKAAEDHFLILMQNVLKLLPDISCGRQRLPSPNPPIHCSIPKLTSIQNLINFLSIANVVEHQSLLTDSSCLSATIKRTITVIRVR